MVLGDSFASGVGAPPFSPESRSCHRSKDAWPLLVAHRLKFKAISFACSSARVEDLVTSDPSRNEPEKRTAQIGRLARIQDANIVLVMVGGNDVGFRKVLLACAVQAHCEKQQGSGEDSLAGRIDALATRLPDVYRRVKGAAPTAHIAVVGYPHLFPQQPAAKTCAPSAGFSAAELRFLNAATDRLNGAIAAAAAQAGVSYVDVARRFSGHEISCGKEQWVNHVRLIPCATCSFHPNLFGQRALAVGVVSAVGGRPYRLLRIGGIGAIDFGRSFRQLEKAWGTKLECGIPGQRPCTCYREPLVGGQEVGPLVFGDSLKPKKWHFDAYYDISRDALTDHMVQNGDPGKVLKSAYEHLRLLARTQYGVKFYVVRGKGGSVQFAMSHGRVFGIGGSRARKHPIPFIEPCL